MQNFVNVFSYDMNPNKTNNQQFVTAINCKKEIALEQMILTKKQFNKEDKYIAWHGYQSLKPNEVTPELCHEIGIKLAKQMWDDRFQVVVSTHLDKDHLHNHFCFNFVSFLDSRNTRLKTLGEKYDWSSIVEQINTQDGFALFPAYKEFKRNNKTKYIKPKQYVLKGSFTSVKKVKGLKALYLYYCYRLGYLPKKNQHKPLSPEMKQAWRKIDKLSQQVRLISTYNLNDTDDVKRLIVDNQEQIVLITNQRNQIYNKLRRCKDTDKMSNLKFERNICTKQLAKLRKEIKTANAILTDTEEMKQNIKSEMDIQHQRFAVSKTKSQRRALQWER